MTRLIALILLALALPLAGHAAGLTVNGNIDANWSSLRRISPAQDAIVHLGDTVTVSVSGQVDINQSVRHETHCDLWVFCHDEAIPVHNFRTVDQAPVRVQVRPVAGGPAIVEQEVGPGATQLVLPPAVAGFTDDYEIVAVLAGEGSYVNPGLSGGSYNVSLQVDAAQRAGYFLNWLNAAHPSADTATAPNAIADDLRTEGGAVALALRTYALATFPVPNAANNQSQETLLRAAVDLAPDDTQNTLALARYLRAVGRDKEADGILATAISNLQNKADARSRHQLGDAYLARMDAVLSDAGGIDPSAIQSALSFLDNAIAAYDLGKRPDLSAAARVTRGRLLRGIRTRKALAQAIVELTKALQQLPESVPGDLILQTPDGTRVFVAKVTDGIAVTSIMGGAPSARQTGQTPIGWDPGLQRLLVWTPGGLQWEDAGLSSPIAAPDVLLGLIEVGGGAIVRMADQQSLDYFKDTIHIPISVDGTSIACKAAARPLGGGLAGFSLSVDGKLLSFVCNDTVHIVDFSSGSASEVLQRPIAPAPRGSVATATGSLACGTVVMTDNYPGHAMVTLTLVRSGSAYKLADVPPGPSQPVVLSDQFAFAGDRVLVAMSYSAVARFRCADGGADGQIALPPVPSPSNTSARPVLHWVTDSQLAVVRPWAHSIDLVDIDSGAVSHFVVSPDISEQDLAASVPAILPPASAGSPPSIVKPYRDVMLTDRSPGGKQVEFTAPGVFDPILFTADGARLVIQRPGATLWTAANTPAATTSLGQSGLVAVDLLGPSSLVMAAINSYGWLDSLSLVDGHAQSTALALPDASAGFYAELSKTAPGAYNFLKGLNPPPPQPPGMFAISDIPKVLADPHLLGVSYQVLASDTFNGFAPPGFISPVLTPLSLTGGQPVLAICGRPGGRSAAGAPALPLPLWVPTDQLFLGLQTGLGMTLQPVEPPAALAPPGGIRTPIWGLTEIVPGKAPTLLFQRGPQSYVYRSGGWSPITLPRMPVAGWSPGDGSLLLLVAKGPPTPHGTFDLLRLNSAGGSAPACSTCTNLALSDALTALVPQPSATKILTPAQVRFAIAGAASMLTVDSAGQFVALPDGDDTVVISLASNAEVKRAPLGRPTMLTGSKLALTTGTGTIQYYSITH